MKFQYTNLETCHAASGVVVVIDVIRAFTNAAFAFSRGAQAIYPVSTVEEALQFKAQTQNSLACRLQALILVTPPPKPASSI